MRKYRYTKFWSQKESNKVNEFWGKRFSDTGSIWFTEEAAELCVGILSW